MTRRLLAVLLWASCPLMADVKLAALFSDGMVVQRGMGVAVWGSAGEGEDVTVNFRGRTVKTKAAGGRWLARIEKAYPALEAEYKRLELDKNLSVEARNLAFAQLITVWGD